MKRVFGMLIILALACPAGAGQAGARAYGGWRYDPGKLKPVDSVLKVKQGDRAPDFILPSVSGEKIRPGAYLGKKNVLLSFIPAAWTPVCSDQWPGYHLARPLFEQYETVVIGISVDNIPTLSAWIREMGGLGFDVLSDFWPHGRVSGIYGVLRSDGTAERALFIIDKKGIIRFAHVSDINIRPDLGMIVDVLKKIEK